MTKETKLSELPSNESNTDLNTKDANDCLNYLNTIEKTQVTQGNQQRGMPMNQNSQMMTNPVSTQNNNQTHIPPREQTNQMSDRPTFIPQGPQGPPQYVAQQPPRQMPQQQQQQVYVRQPSYPPQRRQYTEPDSDSESESDSEVLEKKKSSKKTSKVTKNPKQYAMQILNMFKLPLLVAVIFVIMSLPQVSNILASKVKLLSNLEDQSPNFYNLIIRGILSGIAVWLVNRQI
jgi:hypothetical protein